MAKVEIKAEADSESRKFEIETEKLISMDEKVKTISSSVDNDAQKFEVETTSLIEPDHPMLMQKNMSDTEKFAAETKVLVNKQDEDINLDVNCVNQQCGAGGSSANYPNQQ